VLGAILVRGVNDLFVGVEKLRPDGIGVTPRGAEKLGDLGAEKLGDRGAEKLGDLGAEKLGAENEREGMLGVE
jgi:hypothetical protein